MNEKENAEMGVPGAKTNPGKFWLWGLVLFQLLAISVLSFAGIDDTVTKLCGFVILALCSHMDIKAVKKAGYQVPRWWWGMAVFLPPVYLICRVCKTDTAPSERVKRFAPALVWVLLVGLLAGLECRNAGEEAEIQESYRQLVEKELLAAFADDSLFESGLTVDEVVEVSLFPPDDPHGVPRKGQATVKRSTTKGRPASAILRYDFERSPRGLEYSIAPADEARLRQLREMARE